MPEELEFRDSVSSRVVLFPLPEKSTWYTRFLLPGNEGVTLYLWASATFYGLWDNVSSTLQPNVESSAPLPSFPAAWRSRSNLKASCCFSSPRLSPYHMSACSSFWTELSCHTALKSPFLTSLSLFMPGPHLWCSVGLAHGCGCLLCSQLP